MGYRQRPLINTPSAPPPPPPRFFLLRTTVVGVALIASLLAVTMLLHGEHASGTSARRRRERRLRSWAKHERMSIAIALAENLHHSRQKEEGNASDGPRAQKSARAAGCHAGVLKDPEVQWFKGPSLAVSPLTGHDGLDSRTLQFLLAQSLAPCAQELSNVESMVSTSSQLVPEESVEQLELSTPEVRWQWWCRPHPSVAPDLGRFPVALPGVAGSASMSVENLQSVSQLPTARCFLACSRG